HTLSEIAKIDPKVDVTEAEAKAGSLLAGSVAESSIDLGIRVFVDHPWFGAATLHWANKENGVMTSMQLWNPVGTTALMGPEQIVRCLEPVLGKAEVRITDQLTKARSFSWNQGLSGESARIGQNNLRYVLP